MVDIGPKLTAQLGLPKRALFRGRDLDEVSEALVIGRLAQPAVPVREQLQELVEAIPSRKARRVTEKKPATEMQRKLRHDATEMQRKIADATEMHADATEMEAHATENATEMHADATEMEAHATENATEMHADATEKKRGRPSGSGMTSTERARKRRAAMKAKP